MSDWLDRAACRTGIDPDWFYAEPESGASFSSPRMRKALNRCRTCPVRRDCLHHALVNQERWGIWGGTRETVRRPLINHIKLHPQDLDEVIERALTEQEEVA